MTSKTLPEAGATRLQPVRPRATRLAAAVIALTGIAVALVGPVAASAQAPADLRVEVSDVDVAPGGRTAVWLRTYADPAQRVQAGSVTFRLSANLVAAGLRVDIDDANPNCSGGDSSITCSFEDTFFDFTPAGKRSTGVVLFGGASAPLGTEGTITATFRGSRGEQATTVAEATVVEGVSLVAGAVPAISAKPGSSFAAPLTVRNAGANVTDGVGLSAGLPVPALAAGARFRNCRYAAEQLVSCRFDQQLQPGTTYRATLPFLLRGDTLAPVGLTAPLTWRTSAQHDAHLAEERALGRPAGSAGDGPVLALEPVATAAAKRQADVDDRDNTSRLRVSVTGRNGVDLVALGVAVNGGKGDVVPAAVGLRNDGPAALDPNQPTMRAKMRVTLPRGTEIVTVPARCRQVVEGDPEWRRPADSGAFQYLCTAGGYLAAGAVEKFRFELRITEVIAGATGELEVIAPCGGACELDRSDDKALIVVNGAGGTGGGGLPVTGTPIAAVVGTALLLLLAGAGGVVVARRRRTRFLA
ncbi:hypothetical protein [Actinoplanes nipponensis]|nr:hypothetical protein [Actinoplanes nipponensis]